MKRFISIVTLLLLLSCSRYRDNQNVLIKLNGCKGTIVSINELEKVYQVRYVDKNGVFHTEKFEENEIQNYVQPLDTIQ